MPLVVRLGPSVIVSPVPFRVEEPVVSVPLDPSRVRALLPVPAVTLSAVSWVSMAMVMFPLLSMEVVRLSVL